MLLQKRGEATTSALGIGQSDSSKEQSHDSVPKRPERGLVLKHPFRVSRKGEAGESAGSKMGPSSSQREALNRRLG